MKTPDEMFASYKSDLLKQAKDTGKIPSIFFNGTIPPSTGWTRFNVIEYVCSFPKINPFKMAVALIADGIKVYFDDSSISSQENKSKETLVLRYVKQGLEG